jgi:hypothetical protein
MKKFTVLLLAALLVVAFTVPASALENIFGGYWQTRFATQKNFDGDNAGNLDIRQVDTRTRLYYTAKLNDKVKLVNKFEMDTQWGNSNATAITAGQPLQSNNWGDAGADGVAIEIKNSYADFNVGPVNFLVGIQNFKLARGFINDDDTAGMKAIWKVNEGLYLPFVWQKIKEGGVGADANAQDLDTYTFSPIIYLTKDIKINPYYVLLHSRDGLLMAGLTGLVDNLNASVAGVDFDAKMGAASLWFTGIMQFGTVTDQTGALTGAAKEEIDLKGYLLAAGGKFDLGKADIHGQAFFATGEENGYTDKEINAYFTTSSTAYYWAEIMGNGIFDNLTGGFSNASAGAPGIFVSNILAVNLGATVKPMDKLSITADLWYAKLDEKNAFGEDKLGTEADLLISYKLVEGLTLDVVGAYLWAGDATSADGKNDRNPYEFGTRLSLSF